MKKSKHTILTVVLCGLSTAFAAQRIVLEDLEVVDNSLCISYHIEDLLDDKSIEALQRGIKSEIVHSIQLWQHKNFINKLDMERPHPIKVYWDNWEKKYRIESPDENRLTPSIETVKQKCTTIENFILADIASLEKNQKYRLKVQVDFQLISAESYNAISDIFSGGKKQDSPKKKSGFVSMFVNLLGLGDKEFTYESKDFIINDSGQLEYVE